LSRYKPSRNYVSGKVVFEGAPVEISGNLDVTENLEGVRRYLLNDHGDGL